MIASGAELASYLLGRGLIDNASVVSGDLRIVEEARRNHVFRVPRNDGPSYFVKQGSVTEGSAYVAREAALYQTAESDDRLAGVRRHLPRCYAYDPESGTLILELLAGHRNLREYHKALGRFPVSTARSLGEALGRIHSETSVAGMEERLMGSFTSEPSWVLSIHRPPFQVLDTLSSASIEFIKIVQRFPDLGRHLDNLRREWSRESLIHFDLGWENCLIGDGGIKLVDWEFCGFGDSLWDVGSVLASYLAFWVESMPVDSVSPVEQLPALARYPLENMQPAMRSFWDAYASVVRQHDAGAPEPFMKAVRYCAVRLLEVAYGELQTAQALSAHALVLTQLSLNLLKRPAEAATALFGIALARA